MVTFRDSRAPNVHCALVRPFATYYTMMLCAKNVNVELIAIPTREHHGAKTPERNDTASVLVHVR